VRGARAGWYERFSLEDPLLSALGTTLLSCCGKHRDESPGASLGGYEINSLIGAGGIGEVSRATDTDLARAVASTVLPSSVGAGRDRLAHFQQEADVLAALNHPTMAAIYGLERSDAGLTSLVSPS
jgi:serine/threonine protein kinase